MSSTLRVKKVDENQLSMTEIGIEQIFASASWNEISQTPWLDTFPYKPLVKFQIVHSISNIYLRYEVQEEFVKAQYIRANENVWEDSCVEFFISLDNKSNYYNFEFNVLGTGLIGYGSAVKNERVRLSAATVDRIDTYAQVIKKDGYNTWKITLCIPKDTFSEKLPTNIPVHANFYKCGDGLPNPHFIAWNNIENPTPNFHLPQFFGEITFEQ